MCLMIETSLRLIVKLNLSPSRVSATIIPLLPLGAGPCVYMLSTMIDSPPSSLLQPYTFLPPGQISSAALSLTMPASSRLWATGAPHYLTPARTSSAVKSTTACIALTLLSSRRLDQNPRHLLLLYKLQRTIIPRNQIFAPPNGTHRR